MSCSRLLLLCPYKAFRIAPLPSRPSAVASQKEFVFYQCQPRLLTTGTSNIQKIVTAATERVGETGRRYAVERTLQEKQHPTSGVYLATAGNERFILKDVPRSIFEIARGLYQNLDANPYLRLPQDTIPGRGTFVYKYFSDHFLDLVQRDLPINLTKRILKDTLRGIAALHDKDIVHADIKPNNIAVECTDGANGLTVEKVQLADIEDAAHVPTDSSIVGKQVGNMMWRSPEGHAYGPVNKPSDIFSFGIVCIYAMTKRVIFAVAPEELGEGEQPLALVIERQISYFADQDSFEAFMRHIGEASPWCEIFKVLRDGFNAENPRRPFSLWEGKGVEDADFKDLVGALTHFDPAKRLTAHQALAHKWFDGI
ncbi:hypothetical protein FQN54_002722 [Arachnomyces sp. PD_36]|nr:hypothetical protein FQN54_002722 [Arachnomyces sp. PD_36]